MQDPITIECIESFDFTVEDLDDNDLLAKLSNVVHLSGSWQVVGTIA